MLVVVGCFVVVVAELFVDSFAGERNAFVWVQKCELCCWEIFLAVSLLRSIARNGTGGLETE